MIRKKIEIIVAEGIVKEAILDAISAWQASPTIRTQEALWDLVERSFSEFENNPLVHYTWNPLTKRLILMEGSFRFSYIKYKFKLPLKH